MDKSVLRMPAEWEPHRATWIAWPHAEDDWHDKFATIEWVYAEIVRVISTSEFVEILVDSEVAEERVRFCLDMHRVDSRNYRLHQLKTNRSWLRDSGPTIVLSSREKAWIGWKFNAWAKYDNFDLDASVPDLVSRVSGYPLIKPLRPDNQFPLVLEGGAIETDGQGTLIVTEECLQSEVQCRNPGLTKAEYEKAFLQYLGIEKTIWLIAGCEGDDTHGHIDDVARFYSPSNVFLAFPEDPTDPFHKISLENERILKSSKDALGRSLNVVRLPMPREMYFGDERLPASYANFYITNKTVLVPTFNDKNDRIALDLIQQAFPSREVVGIASTDLVLGFGTLHCLTQQEVE
jgi:agmatine deiminase